MIDSQDCTDRKYSKDCTGNEEQKMVAEGEREIRQGLIDSQDCTDRKYSKDYTGNEEQ